MMFRHSSETEKSLKNLDLDTKSAREKAFTVFISLCKVHGKYILPNIKNLIDKSQELWKKNEIMDSELALMYEAFGEISNEFQDYDKQFQFFGYILNDQLDIFTSKNMTDFLSKEIFILKAFEIIKEENEELLGQLKAYFAKIPLFINVNLILKKILQSIASRTPENNVNFNNN
jgi:hypothetical protein